MATDDKKTTAELAKTAQSTGDVVLGTATSKEDKSAAVTANATQPDQITEKAKLGGQTVEDLKAPPEEQEPLAGVDRSSGSGNMRLIPNDTTLLVGNNYTAEITLDDKFSEEMGDVVTFIHPAGWDVKAAVVGHTASGSFLIERPRSFQFGFKVNGKKIASAKYETRDA